MQTNKTFVSITKNLRLITNKSQPSPSADDGEPSKRIFSSTFLKAGLSTAAMSLIITLLSVAGISGGTALSSDAALPELTAADKAAVLGSITALDSRLAAQMQGGVGGAELLSDNASFRPAGAITRTSPSAANTTDEDQSYVVQSGDTLSHIAEKFGKKVAVLQTANNLLETTTVREKQIIRIPAHDDLEHVVESGDTVSEIADRYEVEVADILEENNVTESSLVSDTVLRIPGGVLPVVKAVATVSAPKSSTGGYCHPAPGARRSQGLHGNNAVDFAAAPGTSVAAMSSGTVVTAKVGGWNGGYGNYIDIKHDNGTMSRYAHLSSVTVGKGQRVACGQVIGGIGNTGKSTGPHVHFEVRGASNPF